MGSEIGVGREDWRDDDEGVIREEVEVGIVSDRTML